jgi:hypothetical protein
LIKLIKSPLILTQAQHKINAEALALSKNLRLAQKRASGNFTFGHCSSNHEPEEVLDVASAPSHAREL